MKYCPNCGNDVEGSKFCSQCGNPVGDSAPPKDFKKPKKKKKLFGALKDAVVSSPCPICGKDADIHTKTSARYNGDYICRKCYSAIIKSGINAIEIKKKSLDELKKAAKVEIENQDFEPMDEQETENQDFEPIDEQEPENQNPEPIDEQETEKKQEQHKKSRRIFTDLTGNRYLAYSYYDVKVAGNLYRDFDFGILDVDKTIELIPEPENEHDSNAIKVVCEDTFIGYIPQSRLQKMILDYVAAEDRAVRGFIYEIDGDTETINIALGFYIDGAREKLKTVVTPLTKTNAKDFLDTPRYENLDAVIVGDDVNLIYDEDSDTYFVSSGILELGEVSAARLSKLFKEDMRDRKLAGKIENLDYNDAGRAACNIRVYLIK